MKTTLMIIAAFILLISAWSSLIMVAMKYTPETIEVAAPAKH